MKQSSIRVAMVVGVFAAAACATQNHELAPPTAQPPANSTKAADNVNVELCDGETTVSVPKDSAEGAQNGQAIASSLMDQWLAKHPDQHWEKKVRTRHGIEAAADNFNVLGQNQGHSYGVVSKQDVLLRKRETERFALAGSRVFHSGDELGSTVGVSCDMCHPNGANTHPESYPKFQRQLGRVVLLRDMVNWCIEHPVRGKPMAVDDPRMRAMDSVSLCSAPR